MNIKHTYLPFYKKVYKKVGGGGGIGVSINKTNLKV